MDDSIVYTHDLSCYFRFSVAVNVMCTEAQNKLILVELILICLYKVYKGKENMLYAVCHRYTNKK